MAAPLIRTAGVDRRAAGAAAVVLAADARATPTSRWCRGRVRLCRRGRRRGAGRRARPSATSAGCSWRWRVLARGGRALPLIGRRSSRRSTRPGVRRSGAPRRRSSSCGWRSSAALLPLAWSLRRHLPDAARARRWRPRRRLALRLLGARRAGLRRHRDPDQAADAARARRSSARSPSATVWPGWCRGRGAGWRRPTRRRSASSGSWRGCCRSGALALKMCHGDATGGWDDDEADGGGGGGDGDMGAHGRNLRGPGGAAALGAAAPDPARQVRAGAAGGDEERRPRRLDRRREGEPLRPAMGGPRPRLRHRHRLLRRSSCAATAWSALALGPSRVPAEPVRRLRQVRLGRRRWPRRSRSATPSASASTCRRRSARPTACR